MCILTAEEIELRLFHPFLKILQCTDLLGVNIRIYERNIF